MQQLDVSGQQVDLQLQVHGFVHMIAPQVVCPWMCTGNTPVAIFLRVFTILACWFM